MASSVAVLGPFVGGLNEASDASAIADNELSECINFNVDLDGSLVARPPIFHVPVPITVPNSYGRVLVIGSAKIGNSSFIITDSTAGVVAYKVSGYKGGDVEWLQPYIINASLRSDCAIQLHNQVFILARPDSPVNGGTWSGTAFATDASSPRGSSAVFFKGRVWVAPGAHDTQYPRSSQLVFSDPVPLALPIPWNPVNLIPVGQGDGENLIDILVVSDNLMLFKNNSTYAYVFDVSPNEGIVRKINNNIGTSAQFCVLTHQNEAYTYHEGNVYQIANYQFVEASIKVPFDKGSGPIDNGRREMVSLSLVGDTILLRYFNSTYALNLLTKTWSKWESADGNLNSLSRVVKLETNLVASELEGYYGGSINSSDTRLYRVNATHDEVHSEYIVKYRPGTYSSLTYDVNSEPSFSEVPVIEEVTEVPIQCVMATKIFDFNSPHMFKRLMWWGVDLISNGQITGIANPVRQTSPVTWDEIERLGLTWDRLYQWDNLLQEATYVETNVDDPYVLRRKFIKMLKSLRFRHVSFIVKLNSNGKIDPGQTLGPARVFTISAIVGGKQIVVKQVE